MCPAPRRKSAHRRGAFGRNAGDRQRRRQLLQGARRAARANARRRARARRKASYADAGRRHARAQTGQGSARGPGTWFDYSRHRRQAAAAGADEARPRQDSTRLRSGAPLRGHRRSRAANPDGSRGGAIPGDAGARAAAEAGADAHGPGNHARAIDARHFAHEARADLLHRERIQRPQSRL